MVKRTKWQHLVITAALIAAGIGVTTSHPATPAQAASAPVTQQAAPAMTPQRFVGQIVYVPGYGVNLMQSPGPNATWTGKKLAHGTTWQVYGYSDVAGQRYYNVGASQWVSGQYLKDKASLPTTPTMGWRQLHMSLATALLFSRGPQVPLG